MFKTAKVIAKPAAAKKSTKEEINIGNLKSYAELKSLIASLEGIAGSMEAGIKAESRDIFINMAAQNGKRPESFRGIDGTASASVEMRKRSTMSVLTSDQQALLATLNIKGETVIVTQELYGINPAYAEDADMLGQVEAALSGIVPEDFIIKQEGKSKVVVNDDCMDAVFKAIEVHAKSAKTDVQKDAAIAQARALVECVGVLALKPKLEVTDIGSIFDSVRAVVVSSSDEEVPA